MLLLLHEARAALMEAEANAGEAIANAARARTLQTSGALSAQQISQYMTAETTARARIASSKAALSSQQLRLKYTQVVAPDSAIHRPSRVWKHSRGTLKPVRLPCRVGRVPSWS